MRSLRVWILGALLVSLGWAASPRYALVVDVPSTALVFEAAFDGRQVAYALGDPFYLELGAGYRYYFWGEARAVARLNAFARVEGVYSFLSRDFRPSNVALGVEVSPDGRFVAGAEVRVRPLEWSSRLASATDAWDYLGLVLPRVVAGYRIPLGP
ncbi:hypothetical protein [Oceanithermus sp.]